MPAELDWRMPPLKDVQVLGCRIAYYEAGAGAPLVLAHGFSGSAYFEWGRVLGELARDFRVVAPQLIGFAPSEQPDNAYTTDDQLNHLSEFMRALGLEGGTLAGESYGGWLVAAYAARAAESGSKLAQPARYALLGGAVGSIRREDQTGARGGDPAFWAEVESRLAELNPHQLDNDPTRERIVKNSDLGKGSPDTAALGKIAKPVLLLWGRDDELIPLRYGEAAAAAIPGSRLEVLDGVGHIPSIEAPRDFIRIVGAFAKGSA